MEQKIQDIGNRHNLHIDQIGVLNQIVSSVLSGKIKPDQFVEQLEEKLGITVEEAINIATDINVEIFIGFRSLKNESTNNDIVNRETLIESIENPAPAVHPISIAQPKPSEKMRPSSGDGVAREFIGEKLVAPVSLPSQKIVVPPTPPQPVTTVVKPKPALDPYREPIE